MSIKCYLTSLLATEKAQVIWINATLKGYVVKLVLYEVVGLASLPLTDQHHVGIAPVFEHTRQKPLEGEEETRENYGATRYNLQHPALIFL